MKLKLITLFIIAINVLLLSQEIPFNVIALTISTLIFSLFIKNKIARNTLKIILLVGSIILLRYQFKTLLVTECGVSFVLLLSSLKFWELNEERDHFNMFLILSLCECSIFLLNPTFLIFTFGMAKMLFYFYYILKIRNYDITLLNPRRLLLLVTPSIILSLILFYTFPRFTQGFINSSDMQYIISGGSSRLDFKQLGPLSVSSEQAFKVTGLEKTTLPVRILYWRTSVLWQLTGQEWSAANSNLKQINPVLIEPRFKYDVEVFQDFKEYMPVLDGSSSILNSNQNFNSYSDNSFRLKTMSRASLFYTVVGNYADRSKILTPIMEKKGLRLKSSRIDEIKKAYFENAENSSSDEARLRELVKIFKNRVFEYNLNPPAYNSIEDFILTGKSGYCSHFASAFTYLARVYNLPARMVNGYLGGQMNPFDGSVIVRELDAHIWVEVFLKEKGWVKVDPTALVAPARIEMSADDFNKKLNPYITIFNIKVDRDLLNFKFFENASLWLNSMNSKFNTNVFNFDREKQLAILKSFTPKSVSIGWIFSLSLSLFMMIFWLIFYLYGKEKISPDEKRYRRFLKRMNSYGVSKEHSETISRFRDRCLGLFPNEAPYINNEVAHYLVSFYK
ncbi:MAG: DUF3488 domain-containing protein [Rhizobacter sp.]|nr:DUF3488 domain-containing protein [Bacteriovorax sp.]